MKGVKPSRGRMVVVDWLDATAHPAGWDGAPENKAEWTRSVGIVTAVNSHAITLAADWSPIEKHKGDVNRAFTIPLGMVQRIRSVKL